MTTALRVDLVDLSNNNRGPYTSADFDAAKKDGVKGVYHKATEGTSFRDPLYQDRRQSAHAAGVPFGAYHFASPDGGDAVAEAEFFLATATPEPGDLLPAVDIEPDAHGNLPLPLPRLQRWAQTFVNHVHKKLGVWPVVYSPWDLGPGVRHCLRWRPRYSNSNARPGVPWDIFQFSNGALGVPNHVAGFGHVDLSTFGVGVSLHRVLIPRPRHTPAVHKRRLHVMHASMQFSDTKAQHEHDVAELFDRAKRRNVAWLTGTEAGPGAKGIDSQLAAHAERCGFYLSLHHPYDTWVAVRKDLVVGGSWKHGADFAIPDSRHTVPTPHGRWGQKGIVWGQFSTRDLGQISVGAVHYITHKSAASRKQKVDVDSAYALAIGKWGRAHGAGSALAFVAGDFNLSDRRNDVFHGQPFLSAWDELHHWEDTGHGNIDVVASYAPDKRVRAAYIRAMDDTEVRLFNDHFLVEAGFDVRVIR